MYTSETFIRVRYGETDQMRYVYYGNYAMYYEVARVESLRQLGLTYKALEGWALSCRCWKIIRSLLRRLYTMSG